MSRLARLVADARRPLFVDVLGLRWYLRVPSALDLFGAGATQLPRLAVTPEGVPAVVDVPEIDPSVIEASVRMSSALLCASVTGVSEIPDPSLDGAFDAPPEIEALTLVPELADERPDEGILWAGSLAPSVQATILAGLTDHLSGGALGRAIATFRARPE